MLDNIDFGYALEEASGIQIKMDTPESLPAHIACNAFLLLFHVLLMAFASLTFAIQGLVVGSETYHGNQTLPFDPNSCSFKLGVWMIVSGSLFCFLCFFNCCIKNRCCTVQSQEDSEKRDSNNCFKNIAFIVKLVIFAWDIYGMVLLYTQKDCDDSQFQVFSVMVQFLFYGGLILGVLTALLCCSMFCFSYDKHN